MKSFLTRLVQTNIPEFPSYRARADSPGEPHKEVWGNKYVIFLLHKKRRTGKKLYFGLSFSLDFYMKEHRKDTSFLKPIISCLRHSTK